MNWKLRDAEETVRKVHMHHLGTYRLQAGVAECSSCRRIIHVSEIFRLKYIFGRLELLCEVCR